MNHRLELKVVFVLALVLTTGTARAATNPKPVLDILKEDNTAYDYEKEALNISNHVTTKELPIDKDTLFATTSRDTNNFRIQVLDPNATGNAVQVELKLNDKRYALYSLSKKEGNVYRGLFLRLVSDSQDDAASGNGVTSDPETQTILAHLGDTISVSYGDCIRVLKVGRPAGENNNDRAEYKHDIRTVKIKVFRFDFDAITTEAEVDAIIEETKARFEQSTIRVEASKEMNLPTPDIIKDARLQGAQWHTGQVETPTEREQALYEISVKELQPNTIKVFIVPSIYLDLGTEPAGMAYGAARNKTKLNSFKNFIIINKANRGVTRVLGHEMMHIMFNEPHSADYPDTALFDEKLDVPSLEKNKRIGPYTGNIYEEENDTQKLRENSEKLP